MHLQHSDESLASSVGLQSSSAGIVRAAVDVSRRILGADSTFAAVAGSAGGFPMTNTSGIRDPRFRGIMVRPGAGLGGQVLLSGRPHSIADYAHDPTISRDFVHVVSDIEGLGGMACVPVVGPAGVEALLYVGARITEAPGDLAIGTLERVAGYAEVGLHHLAARKLEVELERLRERQRLATELHDSVAQMLFAIGVAAHYSQRQRDPEALLAAMEDIEATAADARRELRETLEQISQVSEGMGFEARLAGEIRLVERQAGREVRLTRHGEPRALAEPAESLILDTVIEGLRNSFKHSGTHVAIVHLGYGPGQVTLTVQAPHGEATTWQGSGTGAGLVLLRRRAEQLRGVLEFAGGPNGLDVLRLELPISGGADRP